MFGSMPEMVKLGLNMILFGNNIWCVRVTNLILAAIEMYLNLPMFTFEHYKKFFSMLFVFLVIIENLC